MKYLSRACKDPSSQRTSKFQQYNFLIEVMFYKHGALFLFSKPVLLTLILPEVTNSEPWNRSANLAH